MSALRWFRFHAEALDNMRVQSLPPHLFKTWVNLQCILCQEKASSAGKLPPIDNIAFRLRMSVEETVKHLDNLVDKGLITSKRVTKCDENGDESVTKCDENGHQKSLEIFEQEKNYFLKNWSKKQYKSDSSTERTRRYRERHRNVTGTPPDQSQNQNRSDQNHDGFFQNEKKNEGSSNQPTRRASKNYDIDRFIKDTEREAARLISAGWDQKYLMRMFNEFIVGKEYPRYPGKAYIAWVKKFVKDKKP